MSKNAVAYYRASTRKQKNSIDSQKEIIEQYCYENDINIILKVEEISSGMKKFQNKLSDLLEFLKKEKNLLICSCPDRLTREYAFGKYIVENYDVVFCSNPNMNYETKLNELYFAEKEVKKIRNRTKEILKRLKKNGTKLGNPNASFTLEMRMMAYKAIHEKANKNKNNLLAKEIIKSMLVNTNNYSEIARYLNENNYKTSKNKSFCSTTIRRLIKRYNLK